MMANPFKPAGQSRKYLKVAVYGPPGSGKSHFALTFPRPAVIDTENGTDYFTNRFEFQVLKTKRPTEVQAAIEAVERGEVPCETLVIDSFTVINDVLKETYAKIAQDRARARGRNPDDANLTPRDWGLMKTQIRSMLTRLYNLPAHTVITGWIKDEFEGEGDNLKKIGEKMDADAKVLYQPDIVLRLEKDRHGNFWGIVEKDRTGMLPAGRIKDPSFRTFEPVLAAYGQGLAAEGSGTEEDAANAEAAILSRPAPSTAEQQQRVYATGAERGLEEIEVKALMFAKFGTASAKALTSEQAQQFIDGLATTDAAKLKDAAVRLVQRHRETLMSGNGQTGREASV